MSVVTQVNRVTVKSLKDNATAYVGDSTGMFVPNIGQVIIVSDDKEKVSKVLEILSGGRCVPNQDKIRKVAVIPEEKINY